jgi:hypothetical protein
MQVQRRMHWRAFAFVRYKAADKFKPPALWLAVDSKKKLTLLYHIDSFSSFKKLIKFGGQPVG